MVIPFTASKGTRGRRLAFVRAFDDPMLQLSGRFYRGGEFVQLLPPVVLGPVLA
jgi:hypothetical protein